MDTPGSRAKESWMEPLQPTVRQGVVQLKDFITKLVDIEEKEGKDFTSIGPKACVRVSYLRPPTETKPSSRPAACSLFCFRPGLL